MFFILSSRRTPQSAWEDEFSRRYDCPKEAAAEAKRLNEYNSAFNYLTTRYRVRKIVDTDDDNFFAREAALNHTPVPWTTTVHHSGMAWMLPHLDPDNKRHVRFYRRVEDAVSNKYTSMLMSRFLSNFESISEDDAQDILIKAGFYGDMEFGITNDRDKIIDIYTNGPTSCMNDPEEYDLPEPHPAIVYSEGDFAVAYIGGEGNYSSRAVICPTLKAYYCIYGHNKLMENYLKEQGYEYKTPGSHVYEGMRLKAIPYPDGYESPWLMPYVDFCEYANLDENEEFFVLTHDWKKGEYMIRSTTGSPEGN